MADNSQRAVLPADFFDELADSYDADFSERLGGRWLRQLVNETSDAVIEPGARLLEIGCGTGQDALRYAGFGCEVVATDACENMLANARLKISTSACSERITFLRWDANEKPPAELSSMPAFDVIFSNFGALNCVRIDPTFVARLSALLKPGGSLIAVMMGPCCLWEMVWFGVRGQRNSAFRRLRRGKESAWEPGVVSYPSAATLARLLAPTFSLQAQKGIGIFLPPSFAFHLIERWPRFFGILKRLERHIGTLWPFTRISDHHLTVFAARRPDESTEA
ncbi:MAG: class I SAM-dependent methyltransferase [Gammaproteobacteria bacterium]|nr:class I SAM-dependent methyltransferase [Gammaproteobacteria bacterium]